METITIELDVIMEVLVGLIISGIIGSLSFSFVMYKCIQKQAVDMKLMKKATSYVLRRLVHETRSRHPKSKQEIEDLDKTYKDLIDNSGLD